MAKKNHNLFCKIFKFRYFNGGFLEYPEIHLHQYFFAKLRYFVIQIIYSFSPDHKLSNDIVRLDFKSLNFFLKKKAYKMVDGSSNAK